MQWHRYNHPSLETINGAFIAGVSSAVPYHEFKDLLHLLQQMMGFEHHEPVCSCVQTMPCWFLSLAHGKSWEDGLIPEDLVESA